MPRVTIDGIEYVPKPLDPPADPATAGDKAAHELLMALYLHQRPERGIQGAMWAAVELLAPGLAERCKHDPKTMLDVLSPGWQDD